jgi:hypothetical protein
VLRALWRDSFVQSSNFQTTTESVLLAIETRDSEWQLVLVVKTRFRMASGNYALGFELRDARWKTSPRFMYAMRRSSSPPDVMDVAA